MRKRILSWLLIVCMAVSLLPTAFAAGAEQVGTEAEFVAAMTDAGVSEIRLTADITLETTRSFTVAAGRALTIDFDGHTIAVTFPGRGDNTVFTNNGTLTLKNGTLFVDNDNTLFNNYAVMNKGSGSVTSRDMNIWLCNGYPISNSGNGSVTIDGGIYLGTLPQQKATGGRHTGAWSIIRGYFHTGLRPFENNNVELDSSALHPTSASFVENITAGFTYGYGAKSYTLKGGTWHHVYAGVAVPARDWDALTLTPANIDQFFTDGGAELAQWLTWDAASQTLTVQKDAYLTSSLTLTDFANGITLELNGHTWVNDVVNRSANYRTSGNVELKGTTKFTLRDSTAGADGIGAGALIDPNLGIGGGGQVINVGEGTTFTLESGRLVGTADEGVVTVSSPLGTTKPGGAVEMRGGEILALRRSTAIVVRLNGKLDITGGKITLATMAEQNKAYGGLTVDGQTVPGVYVAAPTGSDFGDFPDGIRLIGGNSKGKIRGLEITEGYGSVDTENGSLGIYANNTGCELEITDSVIRAAGISLIAENDAVVNAARVTMRNTYSNAMQIYSGGSMTLTDCKLLSDAFYAAIYLDSGTLTVNSGTYRSNNVTAIYGEDGANAVTFNGGYFRGGGEDKVDAIYDGTNETIPAGMTWSRDNITDTERTVNELGTDVWWRLIGGERTLTFDLNGGTGAAPAAVTRPYGTAYTITETAASADADKTFAGWFTQPVGGTQVTEWDATADMTVYAQFRPALRATAVFDFNGGTLNGQRSETRTGTPGAKIAETTGALPVPVREGHEFAGWSPAADENTVFGAAGTTDTYTAQWTVRKFTITYDGGDPSKGELEQPEPGHTHTKLVTWNKSLQEETSLSAPYICTPQPKPGYRFAGWLCSEDGQIYVDSAVMTYKVTQDVTFTAQWTEESSGVTHYVIRAGAGSGGSISPEGNVRVSAGSSRSFTITAAAGYEIADVLVDGQSVGAVGEYTFRNVRGDHSIEASFKRRSGVADPGDTGVSDRLNTGDHVAFMMGHDTGLFGPNDSVTRAQVAQMFYRLLKDKNVPITRTFDDVPENAWYAAAVNTMASLGIVEGVGSGRFDPERAITRAEFMAIAARFAKARNVGELSFVDVPEDAWYREFVLTAVNYGWIIGIGDDRFAPQAQISRSEAAAIVNRMLSRSADRDFVDSNPNIRSFPDVKPGRWDYYEIMEATNAHDHSTDANGAERWTGLN